MDTLKRETESEAIPNVSDYKLAKDIFAKYKGKTDLLTSDSYSIFLTKVYSDIDQKTNAHRKIFVSDKESLTESDFIERFMGWPHYSRTYEAMYSLMTAVHHHAKNYIAEEQMNVANVDDMIYIIYSYFLNNPGVKKDFLFELCKPFIHDGDTIGGSTLINQEKLIDFFRDPPQEIIDILETKEQGYFASLFSLLTG